MLIDTGPQSTPPPINGQSQSIANNHQMVSSPVQHKYDVVERLKRRVHLYRRHQFETQQKHVITVESHNAKSTHETARLQQQFLNNNNTHNGNSKSKQQKGANSSNTTQRANNKRGNNANNDTIETKSKMPKLSSNITSNPSVKVSSSPSYRTNANAKFNNHSPSTLIDIKPKPSITTSLASSTASTSAAASSHSLLSAPTEIKREVIDNSYFEGVTVDVIRDFLATTSNSNGSAPFEGFNPDIWKDLLSDGGLVDDSGANFGDEEFIAKFLEEIDGYDDIGQSSGPIPCNVPKQHQVINASNTVMVNTMPVNNNRNSYVNASDISVGSYPIQQRSSNANTAVTTIPIRANVNVNSNCGSTQINSLSNANVNGNVTRTAFVANVMPHQGLLMAQQPIVHQQNQNSQTITHHQQQIPPQTHAMQTHRTQPMQMRLVNPSNNNPSIMTNNNGQQQNLTVQLSIQVPQQQSTQQPQPSVASIALKQMAQHVQQKTHHWGINNQTLPQTVVQQPTQSHPQQSQTQQIMPQQMQQQTQQHVQSNQYFNSQHTFWQPQQQHHQMIQQQSQQLPVLSQQQQHQQFQAYWQQPSGQMPAQTQQTQQSSQQHYYNYNNNYFG